MDELLATFAKLNLCQGLSKKQNQQQLHCGSRLPWFSSTVVIPCPAPHPALICSSSTPYPSQSLPRFVSAYSLHAQGYDLPHQKLGAWCQQRRAGNVAKKEPFTTL